MERRCGGLPYVSSRSLTPEETVYLADRSRRATRKTKKLLFWSIFAPIAWPFGIALADLVSEYLQVLIAMGGLILLAVLWLRWADARKISRLAAQAAKTTAVEIFHGVPNESLTTEGKWFALQASGFKLDGSEQTIERLQPSAVVLRVNGQYLNYLYQIGSSEIAERPVRQPLFPARVPSAALHVPVENRRSLTPPEITELEKHAKAFKLKAPWFQFLFAAYFATLGIAKMISPGSTLDHLGGLCLVVLFVGPWFAMFIIGLRRSRSIRRDISMGLVFRVNEPTIMEFLPCSRLIWSKEGTPSLWRHTMSRDVPS
jgi:hypothetical protein